jgi:hypothetical protein
VLGVPAPSHAAAPVLSEVSGAVESAAPVGKTREAGRQFTRPAKRSQASSRGTTAP